MGPDVETVGEFPADARIEVLEQPLWQRLAPGTPLHGELINHLDDWIAAGARFVEQRWERWAEVDEATQLYLDLSSKAKRADGSEIPYSREQPVERSLVVPVTYWSLATRQVQKWLTLTARDPLVHLEGRAPEDYRRARLMEARLRWELDVGEGPLQLYQACWDDERYGICAIDCSWQEELTETEVSRIPGLSLDAARFYGQTERIPQVDREYTTMEVLDPYRLLLDPAVAATSPRCRFIGHWAFLPWLDLYESRFDPVRGTGLYINLQAARKHPAAGIGGESGRENAAAFGLDETGFPVLKVYSLQGKIIPREWHLSDSEQVERWRFAVVDRQVIIRAHRATDAHKGFSTVVGAGEYDAHSPFPASAGEHLSGLQRVSTWLVSSHLDNVRRVLNDGAVYDPALVSDHDMRHPRPGRFVRLTSRGSDLLQRGMLPIRDMIQPLPTVDVTGQHLATLSHFMQWAQRGSAANDISQGMPLADRRTLGEVQEVRASSSQRTGTPAQLLDMQILKGWSARAVANIGRFGSKTQWYRITGDLIHQLGVESMLITPGQLAGGDYDYVVHTATSAPDPAHMAGVWSSMLQALLRGGQVLLAPDPQTGRRISVHAVFNEWLRTLGIRYYDSFYSLPGGGMESALPPGTRVGPPTSMDPARIQEMVRQGNMVPIAAGRPAAAAGRPLLRAAG